MEKNSDWIGLLGWTVAAGAIALNYMQKRSLPKKNQSDLPAFTNATRIDAHKRLQELLLSHSDQVLQNKSNATVFFYSILKLALESTSGKRAALFLTSRENIESSLRLHCLVKSDEQGNHAVLPSDDVHLPSDKGLMGRAFHKREVVNSHNVFQEPEFDPSVDFLEGDNGTAAVLYVPVMSCNTIFGILQVLKTKDSPDASYFTEQDAADVKNIASICACNLEREYLANQADYAERRARALLAVMRNSRDNKDLHSLLIQLSTAARELLLADKVTIYLVDQIHNKLFFEVVQDTTQLQGKSIELGQGVAGTVAETGEVVNVKNAYQDDRFDRSVDKSTHYTTISMLCMPVYSFGQDKPVAVIQAINKQGCMEAEGFSPTDQEALGDFCAEVGKILAAKTMETVLYKNTLVLNAGFEKDSQKAKTSSDFLLQYLRPAMRRCSYWSSYSEMSTKSSPGTCTSALLSPESPDMKSGLGRRQSSFGYMSPEFQTIDLSDLQNWNLDVTSIPAKKLRSYTFEMFNSFSPPPGTTISPEKLKTFIQNVESNYHKKNPFHNWQHAFSVCHLSYLILVQGKVMDYLNTASIFGVLTAALCHDLDHPGNDNSFEKKTKSKISIMFSDDSILERHHLHMCRKLLADDKNNFLENFNKEDLDEVLAVISRCILGTDMKNHFHHISELTQRLNKNKENSSISSSLMMVGASTRHDCFDPDNTEDRELLASIVVHAADLGGQCQKLELAQKWGRRVCEEFHTQTSKESMIGVEVTNFMTGLDDPVKFNLLQFNFIAKIVLPLWNVFGKLFPDLIIMVDNCEANKNYYNSLLQESSTTL